MSYPGFLFLFFFSFFHFSFFCFFFLSFFVAAWCTACWYAACCDCCVNGFLSFFLSFFLFFFCEKKRNRTKLMLHRRMPGTNGQSEPCSETAEDPKAIRPRQDHAKLSLIHVFRVAIKDKFLGPVYTCYTKIRTKLSFAFLRSSIMCLRGSRPHRSRLVRLDAIQLATSEAGP